jgi:hypothetical protein
MAKYEIQPFSIGVVAIIRRTRDETLKTLLSTRKTEFVINLKENSLKFFRFYTEKE